MLFKRWLQNAAIRIDAIFGKVRFLPVQLAFIQASAPRVEYFNNVDGVTLNEAGAQLLKRTIFSLAGFVKNG